MSSGSLNSRYNGNEMYCTYFERYFAMSTLQSLSQPSKLRNVTFEQFTFLSYSNTVCVFSYSILISTGDCFFSFFSDSCDFRQTYTAISIGWITNGRNFTQEQQQKTVALMLQSNTEFIVLVANDKKLKTPFRQSTCSFILSPLTCSVSCSQTLCQLTSSVSKQRSMMSWKALTFLVIISYASSKCGSLCCGQCSCCLCRKRMSLSLHFLMLRNSSSTCAIHPSTCLFCSSICSRSLCFCARWLREQQFSSTFRLLSSSCSLLNRQKKVDSVWLMHSIAGFPMQLSSVCCNTITGSAFTLQLHIGFVRSFDKFFTGSLKNQSVSSITCQGCRYSCSLRFDRFIMKESIFFQNMFSKYTLLSKIKRSASFMSLYSKLFMYIIPME